MKLCGPAVAEAFITLMLNCPDGSNVFFLQDEKNMDTAKSKKIVFFMTVFFCYLQPKVGPLYKFPIKNEVKQA